MRGRGRKARFTTTPKTITKGLPKKYKATSPKCGRSPSTGGGPCFSRQTSAGPYRWVYSDSDSRWERSRGGTPTLSPRYRVVLSTLSQHEVEHKQMSQEVDVGRQTSNCLQARPNAHLDSCHSCRGVDSVVTEPGRVLMYVRVDISDRIP